MEPKHYCLQNDAEDTSRFIGFIGAVYLTLYIKVKNPP